MSLVEFSQVLYDSELGTALRESIYVFPFVESLHLIGLALSVGLILFVDLRLAGLFLRDVPARDILKPLRPWLAGGFALTIITGIFLFIAEAAKVILIAAFPIKIIFILLAGLNAVWFEYKWGRKVEEWDSQSAIPAGVKFAGWTSITFWSVVVITGRLIPYLSYQ